jgi:hypothetical protein
VPVEQRPKNRPGGTGEHRPTHAGLSQEQWVKSGRRIDDHVKDGVAAVPENGVRDEV